MDEVEVVLNKCLECDKEFADREVNPYYVCRTCCPHGVAVAQVCDGFYQTCVHCGKTCEQNFNGRYYECDDCLAHKQGNRAFNQHFDCRKLDFTVTGQIHELRNGKWGSAALSLYFGNLTVYLKLTHEQLLHLNKTLHHYVCLKYPGVPQRTSSYQNPHHYAEFDFRKSFLEFECRCLYTFGANGQDYGTMYGTLSFITQEGCLSFQLSGPQLHSFCGICTELGKED